MSFYVEKRISLVSGLKSSATTVLFFILNTLYVCCNVSTDGKARLQKRKMTFKINSYINRGR